MARGTTLRNIRMDDEMWEALQRKAADNDMDASKAVRWLVQMWLDED